jgi:hypothetical protein
VALAVTSRSQILPGAQPSVGQVKNETQLPGRKEKNHVGQHGTVFWTKKFCYHMVAFCAAN